MSHGPVMFDLAGTGISKEERELLRHPAAGGIILFSRNYESPEQLLALTEEIHALRRPGLLVAVDQEGGRVQRFREGFTRLPPAVWYGNRYEEQPKKAREATHLLGWLMAAELRACGVDFSFAPVMDLANPISCVIGDRGFHSRPDVVSDLAGHWINGVREGGMSSVGKHFPGHGCVAEDSHYDLPVDTRRFEDLLMADLIPFERLIDHGLEAIMPAHVIYRQIDPLPAGFSPFWLQQVLRERFSFQGVIFSDDLNMAAAQAGGDYRKRARAALEAGCDMVLVCNNREAAVEVLDELKDYRNLASQARLVRMHGRKGKSLNKLHMDLRWRKAVQLAADAELQHASLALDL